MRKNRVIVWFRQDLRMHDNEAFTEALQHSDEVIPVYVFDPRVFRARTLFDFPKTGIHRARFIAEAVHDLRCSIRQLGSDLIIRTGKPEEEIFEIARSARTSWVFCNRERTGEEKEVQNRLERNLWTIGQEVRFSRGKMLLYTADLPFPVNHTPDHFATFRKETERIVAVREPLPMPRSLKPFTPVIDVGEVPDIGELTGLSQPGSTDSVITGGESTAFQRLERLSAGIDVRGASQNHDLWRKPNVSAWLSQGCLSPKMLYAHLDEISDSAPDKAEEILDGLIYRDYLRLMGKKYGQRIFQERGLANTAPAASEDDQDLFRLWANGKTGLPIIDAAMHQLKETGYMPHKLRQLTAQFLVRELGAAWRLGASWFESQLIDYDPCSNWVNWMNIAGVGPDMKEERKVNYVLQAKRLDPEGSYVKSWIPALKKAGQQWVHQPDQVEPEALTNSHIVLGETYPRPVVSTDRWNTLA